jgi:hypothetical protein
MKHSVTFEAKTTMAPEAECAVVTPDEETIQVGPSPPIFPMLLPAR